MQQAVQGLLCVALLVEERHLVETCTHFKQQVISSELEHV